MLRSTGSLVGNRVLEDRQSAPTAAQTQGSGRQAHAFVGALSLGSGELGARGPTAVAFSAVLETEVVEGASVPGASAAEGGAFLGGHIIGCAEGTAEGTDTINEILEAAGVGPLFGYEGRLAGVERRSRGGWGRRRLNTGGSGGSHSGSR